MTTWRIASVRTMTEGRRAPVKILLTGKPGSGKTTTVRRVVERLDLPAGGFYTEEVRQGRRRVGFRLVTLGGKADMLAEVGGKGAAHIGRYRVNLRVLEELGVASMQAAMQADELVVVDEIGPMELLSERFQAAAWAALEGPSPLLATIMSRPHPVADRMKRAPGATLLKITPANRESIVEDILRRLA